MSLPQTTSSRPEALEFPRTLYNTIIASLMLFLCGAVITIMLLTLLLIAILFGINGLRASDVQSKRDRVDLRQRIDRIEKKLDVNNAAH